MKPIEEIDGGLQLRVYLQPKASRDQWQGVHGDEIKLAITAPPIEGKANAYLSKFLAKAFATSKQNITIIKGELSRHKVVNIVAPKAYPEAIRAVLPSELFSIQKKEA